MSPDPKAREIIAYAFEPLDGVTPFSRADMLIEKLVAAGLSVVQLEEVHGACYGPSSIDGRFTAYPGPAREGSQPVFRVIAGRSPNNEEET